MNTRSARTTGSGLARTAISPRSSQADRKTSPTEPLLSSTRLITGSARSRNRHIRSSARSARVGRDPVCDHRPLQIEVAHEVPPLLPIDEGPSRPQGGDALADFGGDAVAASLRREFQAQTALDLRIAVREFDKDRSKALRPERC